MEENIENQRFFLILKNFLSQIKNFQEFKTQLITFVLSFEMRKFCFFKSSEKLLSICMISSFLPLNYSLMFLVKKNSSSQTKSFMLSLKNHSLDFIVYKIHAKILMI
jgi:hypothetical protein